MPLPNSVSSALSQISNTVSSITGTMATKDLDLEERTFQEEVKAVKQWWSDSRWRYTKRPFTAEQIVAKRGTIKMTYANNEISKKLWKILENRFEVSCTLPMRGRRAAYNHMQRMTVY